MLTCRDAARRAASGEMEQAGLLQRLALHLHLLLCRHCRRYRAQLRAIGAGARARLDVDPEDPALRDLEERVLSRLSGRSGDPPGDGD